jgi:hypothetical protein
MSTLRRLPHNTIEEMRTGKLPSIHPAMTSMFYRIEANIAELELLETQLEIVWQAGECEIEDTWPDQENFEWTDLDLVHGHLNQTRAKLVQANESLVCAREVMRVCLDIHDV